jgi:glutamine amidotransferase
VKNDRNAMKPNVGIVGYRMGNISCVRNAFLALGADVFVAGAPEQLRAASHIILPGVGAFPMGMDNLRSLGFEQELRQLVLEEKRPLLGICLGMQLLASVGEEHRVCTGLGFIPGRVTLLKPGELRIPHIGWNDTVSARRSVLLGEPGTTDCFYYVHSFHFVPENPADRTLTCDYGQPFVSGVERGNVFGVQFHPEKSHGNGLKLLRRFTEMSPC